MIIKFQAHFRKLIAENVQIKFMTGFNPARYLGRCTIIDQRDIYHYFNYVREVRPLAFLFPMIDNQFNRSRSNICWLEATMAGSICVAPDWPQWQLPGMLQCNPENFYEVCKQVWDGTIDEWWDEFTKNEVQTG